MNAANILKYFIKKKVIKISLKEISQICKLIGSDVILGIKSTSCILTSNNKIKHYNNCNKFYTLIVKPNFGCSTKFIYSQVRKFNKSQLSQPNKKMFDLKYLENMKNFLEPIVLRNYPKLKKIKLYLDTLLNPAFVRMTGSGSAFVAYYHSKQKCKNAKMMFSKKYKNYWCIASKTI